MADNTAAARTEITRIECGDRMSMAVVANGTVYLAGQVGGDAGRQADGAGGGDDPRDVGDGPEDVGRVREGHDLGPLGDHLVELVEVEPAVVGDPDPPQGGTGAPAQLLPRHEVGVVLHLGSDDLVPFAEPERLGRSTTVLPVTSAGITFQSAVRNGKL